MSALSKALNIVGGPAKMARQLGERQQTVSAWDRRGKGRVPAEHCPGIERATRGAVRCEDLRPDVEWWVLRHGWEHAPQPATGSSAAAIRNDCDGGAHA
jgi:DNA-binding transcriptional regulator YdaS (Cro superfamily)